MDLYKIVGPNGECLNGGSGDWPLPVGDQPGEWRTINGPLEACRNGLHLATAEQVPTWYRAGSGAVVYRVETDGPLYDAGEKWVAAAVRLLPRKDGRAADMVKAAAILARRKAAARRKRDKVSASAAVPAQWRDYLRAVRDVKLPAWHPGAVYQSAYLADCRAIDDAQYAYEVALVAAQRDYNAAELAGIMLAGIMPM